ncbi:MAG TPA: DNA translocase FtsK, partial [Bacteroidetes bacterium]|nr:DNA translocase FtsK [Bacteroidota bacterium]
MATKKRSSTKKRQLSLNLKISDERIPKLAGMICLLLAFYLFIAFTSYLFTWTEDQDKVLRFAWGLLLQGGDLEIANWLGRLGAIVSNMFFYWGFGLPSFIFIFLLTTVGFALIKRTPLSQYLPVVRYSIVLMLILSIVFAFIFRNSPFSWGGAFGEGVSKWLTAFVGNAGTILLFLFLLAMFIIWVFNPNFNELTFEKVIRETKEYFSNLLSGRRPKKRSFATTQNTDSIKPLTTLRPNQRNKDNNDQTTEALENNNVDENINLDKNNQLAIKLGNKNREKPKSLKIGEAELEITPPVETPPIEVKPEESLRLGVDKMVIETDTKGHTDPYDPTLDLSSYEYPVLALLHDYSEQKFEIDRAELEQNKDQIIETLLNYKIEIIKIKATIGPTVTLYEIVPAPGVRISKIKNLEDDIALSLAALGIRIIAPIPGRGTIGIEVPNKNKQIVSLKEILIHDKFKHAKMDLPIGLGKTISNEVFVADLAKMPHLLIAGATGQGKSVGINTILMSILYKKHPSQVKLVLIDPKKVELFPYAKLVNHFLACLPGLDEPIVTDTTKVV